MCVSDTHGRTGNLQPPEGDVLVHAGDFSMTGKPHEVAQFNQWLGSLPHRQKIGTVAVAARPGPSTGTHWQGGLTRRRFHRGPGAVRFPDLQSSPGTTTARSTPTGTWGVGASFCSTTTTWTRPSFGYKAVPLVAPLVHVLTLGRADLVPAPHGDDACRQC